MSRVVSAPRIAGAIALIVVAFGVTTLVRGIAREVRTPVHLPDVAYATSAQCVVCHPGHFESWHRTFHRTMTQNAGPASVLGDFDDATYTYRGVPSRFTHEGDRYFIETLSPQGTRERFEVVMTVGSRRIQQYVTRVDDRHFRLPLAWNIEEKRWIHLNGGFLDPDGSEFNTHFALWDVNCIFCHNVKAQPRFDNARGRFDARVAELGIACEACHGPADLHIRRNANPLRRYLLYLTSAHGPHDPTIHSPRELTPARQIQLCGHCHGQRVPNPRERLAEFVMVGDPYTAGDDLSRITTPIDAHTRLEGVDLSLRFWADGTPRLTAYEYQGLLLSHGHENTKLTCISCHDMHGGDPKGMIRPALRGNQGCLQCHAAIGRNLSAHTKHAPESSGSDCYACHMPRTTYGLLEIHPSHRIQNPDPSRAWRFQMPDACTLCHTTETAVWAADAASRQYGTPLLAQAERPTGAPYRVAESVRTLIGGDVVQRAVAVTALTQEASAVRDPVARLWAAPFLLLTLEDRYPAIRHFAYRGLVRLCERAARAEPARARALALPAFDYLADAEPRASAVAAMWSWWRALDKRRIPHPGPAVPLDETLMPVPARIAELRGPAETKIVAIGE